MKSLLSFSNVDLLFECTYPFADTVTWEREDLSEEAAWGLAWHELAAGDKKKPEEVATAWGVTDAKELAKSVADGHNILQSWLKENEYGIDFTGKKSITYRERSIAYNVEKDIARFCEPPTADTHVYPDRKHGEICGTIDHGVVMTKRMLILDYKTGLTKLPDVWAAGQLLTGMLGLVGCVASGAVKRRGANPNLALTEAPIVAFLHAPRGQIPTIYSSSVSWEKLETHRIKLLNRTRRINDGNMRPGPHCASLYCPNRFSCPTRDAKLLDAAIEVLPAGTAALAKAAQTDFLVANDATDGDIIISKAEAIGKWHEFDEKLRALQNRVREMAREELRKLGHGVRPDGDLVRLISISKRHLSMASIERALGKAAAAREISRLEKLGCIEASKELQIRKVKDV